MFDRYNRHINYLRIPVTDRCNLRCRYCMPEEGVHWLHPEEILSFEEIAGMVRVATGMGINKIRLTGGEPLFRKGIVPLVHMIAGIKDVKDLAMTTNGILLSEMAGELKSAGPYPVKINCVVSGSSDEEDARQVSQFAEKYGLPVRFIRRMDHETGGIRVTNEVHCTGKTGVEMEALMAVSMALLTIYDMCKVVDPGMVIGQIRLIEKIKKDIAL